MADFPECPASLKAIQHYLKTAVEHDNRDPVVAYWCRLHALQVGLKLTSKKTPEETKLLMALMDWLEQFKKEHADNEAISNEVAAQAHLENYALKLFLYADKQDREANFGKNVVKAFYTSGMIYDVMATFGDLTEEVIQNRKYAKWKAAYIHNCLKNGETPVPGPMPDDNEENAEDSSGTSGGASADPVPPSDPSPPAPANLGFLAPEQAVQLMPSVPITPDPNPGGFRPYVPPTQPSQPDPLGDFSSATDSAPASLTADQIAKAQKYCKWASSALTYDDVKTAITNLKNAVVLLQTGNDPGVQ